MISWEMNWFGVFGKCMLGLNVYYHLVSQIKRAPRHLSASVEADCDLWSSHLSGVDLLPHYSARGQVLPDLWWWDRQILVVHQIYKCICNIVFNSGYAALSPWLCADCFLCFPKNNNSVFISPFPFSCLERKEPKDMKAPERVDEHPEGRFYLFCLQRIFSQTTFLYLIFLLYCVFLFFFPRVLYLNASS